MENALARLLFGGAPIERARWSIVATSLSFDADAWPFPVFATRGAFGRTWTSVRYDPQSMQIVERAGIDAEAAAGLPDAKFADAHEVEQLLRARLGYAQTAPAYGVYELRSPLDERALHSIGEGARVQFSTPLRPSDITLLAELFRNRPTAELRVHGFRHGFDASMLEPCAALQSLTLDVHQLQHAGSLRALTGLRTLRIGALATDLAVLAALPALEHLELRGTRASLGPLTRSKTLKYLVLENTAPVDVGALACAQTLSTLVLAHGTYDLSALRALENLQALELRAIDAAALPDLAALHQLERLYIDGLACLTDLRPLTRMRSLRELRITAMPQLNVDDFEPLQACAELRELYVDLGSRRKKREVHRLMMRGNT